MQHCWKYTKQETARGQISDSCQLIAQEHSLCPRQEDIGSRLNTQLGEEMLNSDNKCRSGYEVSHFHPLHHPDEDRKRAWERPLATMYPYRAQWKDLVNYLLLNSNDEGCISPFHSVRRMSEFACIGVSFLLPVSHTLVFPVAHAVSAGIYSMLPDIQQRDDENNRYIEEYCSYVIDITT